MHADSEKLIAFLTSLADLHKRKAADYGTGDDPFYNYEISAEMLDLPGWKSAAMRLAEKFARLSTLCKNGRLENEGAKELFSDMCLISAICWIMFERNENETILSGTPG
jgi:hypothetical protein